MHPKINLGGEGASTQLLRREIPSVPALVVLPILVVSATSACIAPHEIYRLAYEWAQAALRPSSFELATRFVAN
jgi:hypothetical protein